MDPDAIERIMRPGDVPPAVGMLGVAIVTRLRELAADGCPVVTELDGRPVLIELDGQAVVEPPPPAGTNG